MFRTFLKKLLPIILFIFIISSCSNFKNYSFSKNDMEIHFIDVGQGDAILIHINNKNILIDSGPKESSSSLINHLDKYNIHTINYLIATHPHEDHIGNMSYVIKKYNILSFYSPKCESKGKTYENMIDALKNKSLKINVLKSNNTPIVIDKNLSLTVLSPQGNNCSDIKNLNNCSAVILLRYKNTSFLLTGDAEKEIEQSILNKNTNIKADVLKLGHHGSDSSSTENFLKAVSPSLAIISVGKDNSYGHPHKKTLDLLSKLKIKYLRTDINGTIKIISDGDNIKYYKE